MTDLDSFECAYPDAVFLSGENHVAACPALKG